MLADRRSDRWMDMTKVIVALRNFCERAKKGGGEGRQVSEKPEVKLGGIKCRKTFVV